MLDPTLAKIAAAAAESAEPPLRTLPVAVARARIARLRRALPTAVPGVAVSDGSVGRVPVRWYTPEGWAGGTTVVYLHSGGWVLGGLDAPDPMVRQLALRSRLRYASVDYRLAPEHPFPGALEDVQAVVEHVARGGAPFVLHGDSAGGNLAAVIAGRWRRNPALLAQVLVYPVTDSDFTRASYVRADLPPGFLEPEDMRWFWRLYAGDADPTAPAMSPLRDDLAGLPPTAIVTAEYDPLRDEGIAYAQQAAAAGVDVTHWHADDCAHGFMQMTGQLEAADASLARIAQFLAGLAVDRTH